MIQDPRKLQLFKSSVPLCKLNGDGHPCSAASGALVELNGKRMLLTVEHATGDSGDWAIQIAYVPGNGTKVHRLGGMNFLARSDLQSGKIKTVDFAYVEVPTTVAPLKQQINDSLKIIDAIPVEVLQLRFPCPPNINEKYGFSGLIKGTVEKHPHAIVFASERQTYDGLKYTGTRDGDVVVFTMPESHPGDVEFRGCSGSPIIDANGTLIALLTGGCESKNEIYGVSIESYRAVLELFSSGAI